MEIIKQVRYRAEDVQKNLADRIAKLELQLANELAAKQAIIKYVEELENKLNSETENAE